MATKTPFVESEWACGGSLDLSILPEETAVISKVVFVLLEQEQGKALFSVPNTHYYDLFSHSGMFHNEDGAWIS